MSNRNTKVSQIVLSVAIILLCLISLLGITFAIFTNDLNDGTIGINSTSGDLLIDIVDEGGSSLVGKTLDFVKKDAGQKILWEPGATYYTQSFKITNEGNIPINYLLYINNSDEESELAEALEVYITKDPTDPEGTEGLAEFRGSLGALGESEEYYLVVRMKSTAGNKYQNKTLDGIGITVYAVQGNAPIQ